MKKFWQIPIGILGGLIGAGVLWLLNSQPRGEAITLLPPPSPAPLVIHVSGAVPQPAVYHLPTGSRVEDAVQAAGGLLDQAFIQDINLARILNDGDKVLIPYQATVTPEGYLPPTEPTATAAVSFPINLNTASTNELDALPGIGPTRAQDIIAYRAEHGPFTDIKQIQNVSGIGPGTFEKIKDLIVIE